MERSWAFAIKVLEEGSYVRRRSWEKGVWVMLEKGTPVDKSGRRVDEGESSGYLIDDTIYDSPQMVRIMPPGRMHPTREPWRPSFGDMTATDWIADATPDLIVHYSTGELIMAAKTGRPVHFHPHTDMLARNGFVAIGEAPPGWEYVHVRLAVRRTEGSDR